jgi:methyl-accepting chemotaxis protein
MLGNPKNLNIGARLGAGFALLILVGAAVSVFGWLQLKDVKADVHSLMTDGLATVDNVREVKDNLSSMVAVTRLAILQGDVSAAQAARQRVDALKTSNDVLLSKVAAAMRSKESQAKVAALGRSAVRNVSMTLRHPGRLI